MYCNCIIILENFVCSQGTSEFKEKPAIEENAFEALERDFQEVSNRKKMELFWFKI